jgi:hypothetical protein
MNRRNFFSRMIGAVLAMVGIKAVKRKPTQAEMETLDVVFRRAPVVWVKKLDQETTNPIYSLRWGPTVVIDKSGRIA